LIVNLVKKMRGGIFVYGEEAYPRCPVPWSRFSARITVTGGSTGLFHFNEGLHGGMPLGDLFLLPALIAWYHPKEDNQILSHCIV